MCLFSKSTHTCIQQKFACHEKKVVTAGHNSLNSGKSTLTKKILLCFQLKVISSRGEIAFFHRTSSQVNLCMAILSINSMLFLGATPHAQPQPEGRLRGDLISTFRSRKSEVVNDSLIQQRKLQSEAKLSQIQTVRQVSATCLLMSSCQIQMPLWYSNNRNFF